MTLPPRCEEVHERLEAYVDGDLSPESAQKLEDHIFVCDECREHLDLARQIAGELKTLPAKTCPDHVVEAALQHAAGSRDSFAARAGAWLRGLRYPLSPRLSFGTAAVILAVIGLLTILPVTHKKKDPPRYSREEVVHAQQVIVVAFGYVDHATALSQEIIEKENVSAKILKPIRKGLRSANPFDKKGDKS
jgi:anti-sigma factor RsiW